MPFFFCFKIYFKFLVICVHCVSVWGYAYLSAEDLRNQKRTSDSWEQELDSHEMSDVGAGKLTPVLCKSIKCSSLPSYLSTHLFKCHTALNVTLLMYKD